MRTWEMKVHFFVVSMRPFRHAQVSSKFFRRLRTSGDLTLQKRLVLFLHHQHLKGGKEFITLRAPYEKGGMDAKPVRFT